jgi:hypothetical protein
MYAVPKRNMVEREREREERIDGGREGGESSVPSQVRVAQLSAPVSVCMTGVSILHPTVNPI